MNQYLEIIMKCLIGLSYSYKEPESFILGEFKKSKKQRGDTKSSFFMQINSIISSMEQELQLRVDNEIEKQIRVKNIKGKEDSSTNSAINELRKKGITKFSLNALNYTNFTIPGTIWGERVLIVKYAIASVELFLEVKKAIKNFEKNTLNQPQKAPLNSEAEKIRESISLLNFIEAKELRIKFEDIYSTSLKTSNKEELSIKPYQEHLKTAWFDVGIELARGRWTEDEIKEINLSEVCRSVFEQHNSPDKKTGKQDNSARNYLSQSRHYEANSNNNKNIFNSREKIQNIHAFCIDNKIEICDRFLKQYNNINTNK